MAEFPELGQRCNVSSCHQLDFLPFECSFCKKIFCLDHRSSDAHSCPVASSLNVVDSVPDTSSTPGPSCEHAGCGHSLKSVNVSCTDCNGKFCLAHRHPFDHNCKVTFQNCVDDINSRAQTSKAALLVEEIKKDIRSNSSADSAKCKPTSNKNLATAAKVALMKLKQTAIGDPGKVPEEERLYLRLKLPPGFKWKNADDIPMLFSKTWSVGKCVDVTATAANLPIDNNNLGKRKLRLILASGRICEMDENLRALEETGDLVNGGNASLIYE